jgi:dolichyl-phosphate-mannose--protein O-mannosyl transferase
MGLGSLFPAGTDSLNELTGSLRSTWSYRWLNALVGSTVPILVGALGYQLTQRRRFTILLVLLASLDGLFLVESRYALNNIYLIFFGLLGQIACLTYLRQQQRWQLMLAGIFFGCAGSVKWNGFAFLLGIYGLWCLAWGLALWKGWRGKPEPRPPVLWHRLQQVSPLQVLLYLVLIPLLTYSLLWIPHLLMNPEYLSLAGFWRIQVETWQYHQRIGNTPDVHPYCSPWYSWLILWRPVAYYYQTGKYGVVYDVHSMANPILLWCSTGALLVLGLHLLSTYRSRRPYIRWLRGMGLFLGVNYLVNLLPWLKISRCTFFYHYMPAYLFSWFALALILDNLLASRQSLARIVALTTLGLIAFGFLYWLPIFLGLPLTPQAFSWRMLFRSWI